MEVACASKGLCGKRPNLERSIMFPFSGGRQRVRKSLRTHGTPAYGLELLEERTLLSAFTVLNLNDHGAGSLRQAILNANSNPGADVINFGVAGTITLNSALPTIAGQVNIDGTSAPGFAGTPLVEVNFNDFGGLQFTSCANGSALLAVTGGASGNGVTLTHVQNMQIVGNDIGLNDDGTTAAGNHGDGIALMYSSHNTIGGEAAEDRNVISANGQQGILVSNSSTNVIMNNYIGTDVTGSVALGNGANGILMTVCSAGNLIGGEATGGNDPTDDVFVTSAAGQPDFRQRRERRADQRPATANQLSGNFIGTAASGNAALGNVQNGVAIVQANDNSLLGCTIQTRSVRVL